MELITAIKSSKSFTAQSFYKIWSLKDLPSSSSLSRCFCLFVMTTRCAPCSLNWLHYPKWPEEILRSFAWNVIVINCKYFLSGYLFWKGKHRKTESKISIADIFAYLLDLTLSKLALLKFQESIPLFFFLLTSLLKIVRLVREIPFFENSFSIYILSFVKLKVSSPKKTHYCCYFWVNGN